MKKFVIIAALLATTGCATAPPMSSDLQAELTTPLICSGLEECKVMWERAGFIVGAVAGYKIQTYNDTIIETYNPAPNMPQLSVVVRKEPLGEGRYQIWTNAGCNNMFGCTPYGKDEAIARIKRYIRTGIR